MLPRRVSSVIVFAGMIVAATAFDAESVQALLKSCTLRCGIESSLNCYG
jgi:hypothetical protein